MKKNIKFHLTCTIINFILILLLLKTHEYIIDKFIDNLFFIRVEENFYKIYLISLFLFSWLATFAIYKFINYKKHFIIFLISLLLSIFLFIAYDIFNDIQNEIKYYNSFLDYCYRKSYYILFKEETLVASILISISIYLSQMIIGKKLLPKMYIKNSDLLTKV